MILLEKRAHLLPKIPLAVVRLLPVDVTQESVNVRWTNGKQRVSALPCKVPDTLFFHPCGGSRFDLRHDFRRRLCRPEPHREMHMIGNSAYSETLAIQFAGRSGQICVEGGKNAVVDQWSTMFRAEDDMHQVEAQRLRHRGNYMSGLQPSPVSADTYLGLRPRLVCRQAFGLRFAGPSLCAGADRADQVPNYATALSAKGATTYQPGPKAQVGNVSNIPRAESPTQSAFQWHSFTHHAPERNGALVHEASRYVDQFDDFDGAGCDARRGFNPDNQPPHVWRYIPTTSATASLFREDVPRTTWPNILPYPRSTDGHVFIDHVRTFFRS